MDQLHPLGKTELICLISFTCYYMVSFRGGVLFLWMLEMGCVSLLWHFTSLSYTYFEDWIWVLVVSVLDLGKGFINLNSHGMAQCF